MPDPINIVREPDLPRIAAATRAILTELTRPRPSGQWSNEILAPALAGRAIAADDDHGRARGVVTQADGLRWDELEAFAQLVAPALDTEHHMSPGNWHPQCPTCLAIGGHRRITGHARYRTIGPTTPKT